MDFVKAYKKKLNQSTCWSKHEDSDDGGDGCVVALEIGWIGLFQGQDSANTAMTR